MPELFTNFGYGILASSPGLAGTTLSVQAGQGARFAEAILTDPSTHYNLVVWPAGVLPLSSNAEVIRVTAHTALSDTFSTITRAQDSSVAKNLVIGYQLARAVLAGSLKEIAKTVLRKATPLADLQAAINAAETTSKIVVIADNLGDLVSEAATTITGYDGLQLIWGRNTRLLAVPGNVTHQMFDIEGTGLTGSSLLASNALEKTRTVTLAAGGVVSLGLVEDGYIYLEHDETSLNEGDGAFISRIVSIVGDTVQLAEILPEDFTTAANSFAMKWTPIQVKVSGLRISGTGNTNTATHGFLVQHVVNSDILDIQAEDFLHGVGVGVNYSHKAKIEDIKVDRSGGVAGIFSSVALAYTFTPRSMRNLESNDGTGFGVTISIAAHCDVYNVQAWRNTSRNFKVHHGKYMNFFGGNASAGNSSGITPTGVSRHMHFFGFNAIGNDSNNLWWPAFSQAEDIHFHGCKFLDSVSAFDVAINSGISGVHFHQCEWETIDDTGAVDVNIYGYKRLIPNFALVTSAFGNIGSTPHIEIADAAASTIYSFQPVLVPEDFGGNLTLNYEVASSVGGNSINVHQVVTQEALDAQVAAPTVLLDNPGTNAIDAVANTTNLISQQVDPQPTPGRLINTRLIIDRSTGDTNTGTALLKNWFLKYRRR